MAIKFIKLQLLVLFLLTYTGSFSQSQAVTGNPIFLKEKDEPDDVTYLMAGAASRSEGLKFVELPAPKFGWIDSLKRTDQFFKWKVEASNETDFHIDALMSAKEGEEFIIFLEEKPNAKSTFRAYMDGWDKIDAGTLRIPKGISTLVLKKTTATKNAAALRSVELIKEANRTNYNKRVKLFKSDPSWLSKTGYGLMLQYGPWAYPKTGDIRKTPEQLAKDFDVSRFVSMVEETGASYVIWSLTWYSYHMLTPNSSVDKIVNKTNSRTTSTDLIGKIADSLQAHGIRFMLYYHCGQDGHVGINSTDWWKNQNWPEDYSKTGMGNKDVFVSNWINVIEELGLRFGTRLDGWFFDDAAASYYPAPFERMGKAAKAGNPNRLISYNDWIWPRVTDFQEISFGEGHTGKANEKIISKKGDGIFRAGPNKGLLEQGMFITEQDWGIHKPNQPINTKLTLHKAKALVQSAKARAVPLSFNIMMWEDGTVSDSTLNILKELKKEKMQNK